MLCKNINISGYGHRGTSDDHCTAEGIDLKKIDYRDCNHCRVQDQFAKTKPTRDLYPLC